MSDATFRELNLPAWAAGEPSSVHGMTPWTFFKGNWGGWPILFGFALATFLLPLVLFLMDKPDREPNIPLYASYILLGTGLIVMVGSVVMAIFNYGWLPKKVLVYPEGVVWLPKGTTHSKKWSEVVEVWRTEISGQVEIHFVRVVFADGTQVSFKNSLADYHELTEAVEQMAMAQMLSKCRADLAAGKAVAFGKAKLSPAGVAYEGDQWAWDGIQEMSLQQGAIILERGQGWDKNGFIPIREIPNYQVLMQLVAERIGQNAN